MKELFEAENIDRSAPETGTILKEQTRLEKSLTKFCGKEYL